MNPPPSNASALIPPLDEFGLPGPLWLFQFLLPATFFLHVLFMNVTLGTSILLGPMWLLARRRPHLGYIAHRLLKIWPVAISITITTGVAPLLFVQVLYGHLFYTANILLGWTWLTILALLLLSFYAVYLVKRWTSSPRGSQRATSNVPDDLLAYGSPLNDESPTPNPQPPTLNPQPSTLFLLSTFKFQLFPLLLVALIALAFLAIAAIFTANATLMAVPDKWADVHAGRTSPWSVHGTFWPRYLHNVIGALAVTSLFIAILSRVDRRMPPEHRAPVAGSGLLWAWMFTSAQIATGVWLLIAAWSDAGPVLQELTPASVFWGLAIVSGILAWVMLLARSLNQPDRPASVWIPTALITFTLAGMSVGRERLRMGFLSRTPEVFYTPENVHTQFSPLWLFLITLFAGLATIALVLHWSWHARPAKAGPTSDPNR